MDNNRSWMHFRGFKGRQQLAYRNGVKEFLEFAFKDTSLMSKPKLRCPCIKCRNYFEHNRETMQAHLFRVGIDPEYNPWVFHGEEPRDIDVEMSEEEGDDFLDDDTLVSDDIVSLVHDVKNVVEENKPRLREDGEPTEFPEKFQRLIKDVNEELYPGCTTFKRLEFIVTLLQHKVSGRWSDKSFDGLLNTLHKAFNYDSNFPKSSYEAKKYTKDLGLNYVKIHACVNHCILYRKDYANADVCPVCEESRWKEDSGELDDSEISESQRASQHKPRVPRLVLRHFPLAPRLQRLYMSRKIANYMQWHKKPRETGVLKHPADGEEWKKFDKDHFEFAADPRNVRLGLSSDGFCPSAHLGTNYSIWPVFVVPYNLPPWMCMKSPYIIMSLLIPGPKSPGNDIDVFLEPLIDELKDMWTIGVETYDSFSHQKFTMRAALLWTMNDFPAYGNLSGWSTCGKLACPVCHKETWNKRLIHGKKQCFLGHRRFLDANHRWRNDKKSFDGEKERRPPPLPLSGEEVVQAFNGIPKVVFGKKRKRSEKYLFDQWKKFSCFFKLPYWHKLLLRHNLDVMHIEKNICDNILGTVLDISQKTKDNLNARMDLKNMNMHEKLMPIKIGDKYKIPKAPYQLTPLERQQVLELLSKVKVPDGYSASIARWAKDGKISKMKSHDCHVFIQDLLIPAFKGIFPKEVLEPLIEISLFFKQLCVKTLRIDVLDKLEKSIAITLCKLERVFVPSFFDIMVHLPIHLVREARLGGPIHTRWQYRFEREMHTLKSDVRNQAHPEACIAESRVVHECLAFCSMYMSGIETKFNRMSRNDIDMLQSHTFQLSTFQNKGSPLGKATFVQLSYLEWKQAQVYILMNCAEAQPFVKEHASIRGEKQELVDWFRSRIWELFMEGDERITPELLSLSRGPSKSARSYQGYYVNGYRFHTKKRQRRRKTQNSGVFVKGDAESGLREYFGVLKEALELDYGISEGGDKEPIVVIFRCIWFDVYHEGRGIKRDKFGTISVNIKKFLWTDEPFILASQVGQVYYVRAHNEPDWRIAIKTFPRSFFDFSIVEDDISDRELEDDDEVVNIEMPNIVEDDGQDDVILPRSDVPQDFVSATSISLGEDEILDDNEELESEQDEENVQEEDDEEDILFGLHDFDSDS